MIVPFCTVFSLGYSWKVFEQDIVNESSHVTTRYMKMSKSLEDVQCTCPQVHYWAGNEFNILFQRFKIGGLGNWRLIKIFLYWDWVTVFPCEIIVIDNTLVSKSSERPGMPPISFLVLPQAIRGGRDGHGCWFISILCQATYFSAMSSPLYLPILLCDSTICGQCKNCIMFSVMYQL